MGALEREENMEVELEIIERKEPEKVENSIPEIVEKFEKMEVFYALNVEPIRLKLYKKDSFNTEIIEKLYIKSMMKLYMLHEPFHTNFYNILKFIDINDFWIKTPSSDEIIINMRDENSHMLVYKSLITYDVGEIVYRMLDNIMGMKKLKSKESLMLSSIIYVLSKSDNLKNFCVISDNIYSIENCLIDRFFRGYSKQELYNILPKNHQYYTTIEQLYIKAVDFSYIYSTNVQLKRYEENIKNVIDYIEFPKLLQEIPKKELISIK
jgi:hypothetical protein